MQINAFVTDIGHQEGRTGEGRLPVRTAVVTIFVLSLLSWVPIVLPLLAYFHR